MRLYYPVLLVAAVAIAGTNVLADGDGEERSNFGEYEKFASYVSGEVGTAAELEVAPELEALVGDSSKGKGKYSSSSLSKSMKNLNPFRGSSSKMKNEYKKLKKDKRPEVPKHRVHQRLKELMGDMTLDEFFRKGYFEYWDNEIAEYNNAHEPQGSPKLSFQYLREYYKDDRKIIQAINTFKNKEEKEIFKNFQGRLIQEWKKNPDMTEKVLDLMLKDCDEKTKRIWTKAFRNFLPPSHSR
ncbi:hypothetical protein KXD40_005022 [Peronospora effusa]|uniref:RxLR effector protein n=1 Tax=Peronospora effusa TaxID=542832 RepID=A0A3M6VVP3_9STRA|nr:hypothetical protein DD238_003234 [Peronospora effusa]RQM10972.1 hypothetical protein DD237_004272 [Peronospora effusa]UIZ22122.1 hypothetical protein KXD40_005022 [Peronospora effusa]